MSNLDLFVVNVALPDIGRAFHGASLNSLSWILNAYAIVFAALLVTAGRLFDRYGHRLGFLIGILVFTASSVLCAASDELGWLLAGRVLQAVGAAVLLPTSLALLLVTAPPGRRARVVRAWSAVGGVAAALGPVVGGVLVQASWRWVFLINVPVGVLALITGSRVLPAERRPERGPVPDLLGALLLTAAVGLLALGLIEGNDWGWTSPRVLGSLAATPLLVILFVAQSARHRAPVVELPILRIIPFSAASIATALFAVLFSGMILSASLWCQSVWGYSALRTGLALAPGPLMVPPMAALAGPLARRIGNGAVAALGNLLFGGGVLYWALRTGVATGYTAGMLPGFLIGGVGVGLALPTMTAAGATALPAERFATGTGVLTMARQIGAVIGVAIIVVIIGAPHGLAEAQNAFRHGWYATAGVGVLAAVASLVIPRSTAKPQALSAQSPAAAPVATGAAIDRTG
jgi:EmrB/QacA subfamily drug resistance transporter